MFSPEWIFRALVWGFLFLKVRIAAWHICNTVMKIRPERQLNHSIESLECEVEAASLIKP